MNGRFQADWNDVPGSEQRFRRLNPLRERVLYIPRHWQRGRTCRYPVCCILLFCIDDILGRLSGMRRWWDDNRPPYNTHVPCKVFHR